MTLRKRIAALMCALLAAVFLATMAGLWLANAEDFASETAPFERQSAQVAASLNAVLNASSNPEQVLNAFVASLDASNGTIMFRTDPAMPAPPRAASLVPAWFLALLPLGESQTRVYPVTVGQKTLGYISFVQDLYADIYEKWLTFLTVIVIFAVFGLGSLVIVYFGVGTMLQPLGALAAGLEGIAHGDAGKAETNRGPPEINTLIRRTNEIGQTMASLRQENRTLLKSMVAIQDRERDEISRDLHDELGPLLFGLRTHAVSLQETPSVSACRNRAAEMESAIAALQGAHRQILDRLRPMEIREVGLARSIAMLAERAGALKVDLSIASGIDELSEGAARTIYRLVQEALLNIQRHARATEASVAIAIGPGPGPEAAREVSVVISDNGIGFPQDVVFGRGLNGMAERVQALGGQFTFDRAATGARILCRMPVSE